MIYRSLEKASKISLLGLLCTTLLGCPEAAQVVEFLDSISDGAPCTSDIECLGGSCLTAQQGYTGGYCTTFRCEMNGCSGLFSECFRTTVENQAITACYELCNSEGTCDRAAEGYQCVTLEDTPVCLPPNATNAPVLGAIGSSCSTDAQCTGEGAACLQTFFGGYCTLLDCMGSASCPNSGPCVALNPDGATDAEKSFACMAGCEKDEDCRFGYSCQSYEGSSICLEKDENDDRVRNPDGADDGSACAANINCKGGTCVREVKADNGDVSYPGGYCATRDCSKDEDCHGDKSVCIARNRTTSCRQTCSADSECRTGYTCRPHESGNSFCDSEVEAIVISQETPNTSLGITCGPDKEFEFDVPDGAISFYIAPYTKNNAKIRPLRLVTPDQATLDIPKSYSFMAVNPDILGSMAPMLFPATDQPPLSRFFSPGKYTMTVETQASEICYYVVPQMREGTKLSINLHFVGVPGINAEQARTDADIKEMMDTVKRIYGSMDVEVSVANYKDTEKMVTDTYKIVRDLNDIFGLVATSSAPGDGSENLLSVNVFLIEDFNISDTPGLLGVSTGIPGMAGLHGTSGSGLVFSTSSLGSDNVSLGQTMAHEIGHFLGLRHTTEHFGSDHDPISDTPECAIPDLGFLCPDADNFMFAFSLGGSKQTKTTPGQSFVIRRNPLVR